MKIALASDHAGFGLTQKIEDWLNTAGHEVVRGGAPTPDRYDYPLASDFVAEQIRNGTCKLGVLVCGSGIGVCIRANRHHGVRAAQCFTTEMATLARAHNHANVICFGERIQSYDTVIPILEEFLVAPEDHDPRHENRVQLIESNTP